MAKKYLKESELENEFYCLMETGTTKLNRISTAQRFFTQALPGKCPYCDYPALPAPSGITPSARNISQYTCPSCGQLVSRSNATTYWSTIKNLVFTGGATGSTRLVTEGSIVPGQGLKWSDGTTGTKTIYFYQYHNSYYPLIAYVDYSGSSTLSMSKTSGENADLTFQRSGTDFKFYAPTWVSYPSGSIYDINNIVTHSKEYAVSYSVYYRITAPDATNYLTLRVLRVTSNYYISSDGPYNKRTFFMEGWTQKSSPVIVNTIGSCSPWSLLPYLVVSGIYTELYNNLIPAFWISEPTYSEENIYLPIYLYNLGQTYPRVPIYPGSTSYDCSSSEQQYCSCGTLQFSIEGYYNQLTSTRNTLVSHAGSSSSLGNGQMYFHSTPVPMGTPGVCANHASDPYFAARSYVMYFPYAVLENIPSWRNEGKAYLYLWTGENWYYPYCADFGNSQILLIKTNAY